MDLFDLESTKYCPEAVGLHFLPNPLSRLFKRGKLQFSWNAAREFKIFRVSARVKAVILRNLEDTSLTLFKPFSPKYPKFFFNNVS